MKIDKIKITGAAAAVALCLFVLLFGDRSVCFFRGLIGLPCPGCGMTRALYNAACLNFKAAFSYHPLWPLVPPAAIYILGRYFKGKRIDQRLIFAAGVLLTAVYVLRMIFLFPETEPMTFNRDALYIKILNFAVGDIYGK